MVVSEIIERLSPNIEPPSKAPEISGNDPLLSANVTAIGPKATIPTEVPVADRNPAIKRFLRKIGYINSTNPLTTASTPPIALLTTANAPANK
jgi:hypothetical protein